MCFSKIFTVVWGVIAIALFFSSVVYVIGLSKLTIVGFGTILGSLFLNGDKIPSESRNPKVVALVSRGLVGSKKCGGGGKSSSSSNYLLFDHR